MFPHRLNRFVRLLIYFGFHLRETQELTHREFSLAIEGGRYRVSYAWDYSAKNQLTLTL
jgi:hypothetical protein